MHHNESFCDMTTDDGGSGLQRRFEISVSFNRDWRIGVAIKDGFGVMQTLNIGLATNSSTNTQK